MNYKKTRKILLTLKTAETTAAELPRHIGGGHKKDTESSTLKDKLEIPGRSIA
jgi:hypothetical protein